MLLLDRQQHFAQLRLVCEFMGRRHLRGSFNVNPLRGALLEHSRVAQRQSVPRQKIVSLLLARQTGDQIRSNRLQRPAHVMPIQIIRRAVEIRLSKGPRGTDNFVSRVASSGDQNHHDASVRQQNEAHVFEHRLGDGRRNHNPQAARNFRQNVSGALGNFLRGGRGGKFTTDPFFILRA